MKAFLLAISFLFSSNLFCQEKPIVEAIVPIIKWDSLKTNAQYQIEDSIMQKALIGSWKDQNSILRFKKKGKVELVYLADGKIYWGKWSINKGIINLQLKDYTEIISESNCKVLEFSLARLMFQDSDPMIWIANKISN